MRTTAQTREGVFHTLLSLLRNVRPSMVQLRSSQEREKPCTSDKYTFEKVQRFFFF